MFHLTHRIRHEDNVFIEIAINCKLNFSDTSEPNFLSEGFMTISRLQTKGRKLSSFASVHFGPFN